MQKVLPGVTPLVSYHPSVSTMPGKLRLNHRLQRFPVLQASQKLAADHEHRNAGDACLLVCVPVLAGTQSLLELQLVQSGFTCQLRQHGDLADVLSLDKECFQEPVVI